ncbi:MAG: hypothetical protein MK183_00970 [Verrucomicrobiales bacterium]|nr:hypothetical protein [Verrucomicrobiales bacterium]
MTTEDTHSPESKPQESPEAVDPDPPQDDAILRNLASLMGGEKEKRDDFKTKSSPLHSPDSLDNAHEEAVSPAPSTAEKGRDVLHAAEQRRSKRLKERATGDRSQTDGEIDVVFDEDSVTNQGTEAAKLSNLPSGEAMPAGIRPEESLPPDEANLPPTRPGFTAIELGFTGLLGATLIGLGLMFAMSISQLLNKYDQASLKILDVVPDSAQGELLQLEGIQSYWRDAGPNDRVQEGSRILPVISIDSINGKGAIQVIFRDDLGRIRGDSHVHAITSGKSFSAHGTSGMTSEVDFSDYKLEIGLEANEYWTATIKESTDQENWAQIGQYRLSAERR